MDLKIVSLESKPPRILLIGATGPTGRAVLKNADPRDVRVRAFARRPQARDGVRDDVAAGDVLDRASLAGAMDGADAVISALGTRPWRCGAGRLHSTAAGNLIAAMDETGCRRLVSVTGIGAGDSRGHGPVYYDWFARPVLFPAIYADKDREEALISSSGLDWTIVRPAVLRKTSPAKPVKTAARLTPGEKMGSVGLDDVARCLLGEVIAPRHSRQVINVYT